MQIRKQVVMLFLALLILFVCQSPVFAQSEEPLTVKVGYCPNYGIFEDEYDRPYGYICDYFLEIARINRWQVEFIPCTWADGVKMLETGEIDIYGGMQKTPEREKQYEYPDLNMGYEYGTLLARQDNQEIFYNDLQSMDQKTVGISEQSYYKQTLTDFCTANGISLRIITMRNSELLAQALETGEIDLYATGSMYAPKKSKVVLHFSTEEIFFPTTKGNQSVLDGMNYALNEIKRNNLYFDATLYERYYTNTAISRAFTKAEQSAIDNMSQIKVGYAANAAPFSYYDEKTQTAKGILIDLMELVSKPIGAPITYQGFQTIEEAVQKTRDNELDVVLGIMNATGGRDNNGLLHTDPLVRISMAYVMKRGLDYNLQRPATLAITHDFPVLRDVLAYQYPAATIVTMDTLEECLADVLEQKVSACVTNVLMANYALRANKYQPLVILNNTREETLPLAIGIAPTAPEALLGVLNQSIGLLSEDTLQQIIYAHTIGAPYHPSFKGIIIDHAPSLMGCALLLCIGLLLFAWKLGNKINKIMYYDSITGEMTVRKFKTQARNILRHATQPYVVMEVKINDFKAINTLFGHELGDKVLCIVAQKLHDFVHCDAVVCRASASAFYAIAPYQERHELETSFYQFAQAVQDAVYFVADTCKIVLSAGSCMAAVGDTSIGSILDRVDIAANCVQNPYVSAISFFEQAMRDKLNEAKQIENGMEQALRNLEFVLHLQPKVALNSRKIIGAEALMRWEHPEKGMLLPGEFLSLFEKNGFIVDLDFYAFEQACEVLARWKKENRTDCTLSVNLSARHVLNEDTAQRLKQIYEKYDFDANLIELEFTESVFVNSNAERLKRLLNALHDCGFAITMDDFGSSDSCLSMLKDMPINALKINRSLLGLAQSTKVEMLMESLISLSHKMNIKAVSKGVETEQQVNALERMGCDWVQGYYFSQPIPVEQFEQMLECGYL